MAANKKKVKPPVGKFVSDKSEQQLKAAQKKRMIFMYCSTLTLAVILFIPQEWAEKGRALVWLQTLYVLLIAACVIVSVLASYRAQRGCNLSKEISENHKPRAGFEKRTFFSDELFMYMHFILAAAQLGLVIYGFGIWGAVSAALAIAGAALAFISRDTAYRTLKDGLTYLPPLIPSTESGGRESEEQGGAKSCGGGKTAGGETPDGGAKDSKDGGESSGGEDETEDFYSPQ